MNTSSLILPLAIVLVAVYLHYHWFIKVDEMEPILGESWKDFKAKYNKQYESTEEEAKKRYVFAKNLKKVEIHNQKYKKGESSYWLGTNNFSDLTAEEFKALHRGCIKMGVIVPNTTCNTFLPLHVILPDTVDWREKGYVTHVKDQSACGSCWAFSATGSLEGQYFRKTGTLSSFSEQQLVDCSHKNNGCNGGEMNLAFAYIKEYGIESEQDYPYIGTRTVDQEIKVTFFIGNIDRMYNNYPEQLLHYAEVDGVIQAMHKQMSRDGVLFKVQSCKYDASKVVAKVKGYVNIESGCEAALQQAVATIGPVSVAIDVSRSSFQSYLGGVYHECKCNSTRLLHGVLVVGYGTHRGHDYWLVKNSWGESWGENGYIKIARNKGNMCGIATQASYPLV